jgi:hypothetical protein
MALQDIRRSLVPAEDIRDDVGFQNDINDLLAQLEQTRPPWVAASSIFAPVTKRRPFLFGRLPPRRAPAGVPPADVHSDLFPLEETTKRASRAYGVD